MIKTRHGWLFFVFLFIGFQGYAKERAKDTYHKEYFKARILNSNTENYLVPLIGSTPLRASQVNNAKEKVWNRWKEVNNELEELEELEELPEPTHASEANPPLHHWELIDEDPMPFYFIIKGEEAESQKLPLFLNLHGSGPKVLEFRSALGLSKMYDDSPSVYFIPQIPSEHRYRWWYQPVQNAWEKLFRLAMINDRVDPDRIHIIGISEGGYGSQRLGAYYADYLAGTGPMAGGEPLKNAPPVNYRHVAFSFHTGEHDRGFGRNTLTALAGSTFDSLATQYPGDFKHNILLQKKKGHAIDYSLTTPWLVSHKRAAAPDHISWVYFPMDGRYRKGFYNIAIEEFPDIKEEDSYNRIYFDIQFNKKENLVEIKAILTDEEMGQSKAIDRGAISIFLDDRYLNLAKRVRVLYNGKVVHNAKLKLKKEHLLESCGLFGDPKRLFPAKVSIAL